MEKKFFKKLFNHLPYGVLLIDGYGNVVFQNNIAGILLQDIYQGTLNTNFFEHISHSPLKYAVQDCQKKRASFRKEFELNTDNIVQIDCDFYDDEMCPGGVLLSVYSISQFKKMEKHNRQFVANVSHELKTPLTAIIGYIETLIDDEDSLNDQMRGRFLKIIKKNSLRLGQIVNDLLTLSSLEKDEASREGVTLTKGSILAVMKDAVSICEYKANEKNVTIHLEYESDSMCAFNSGLLEQALVNLIDNGIKFTPESGVVIVALSETTNNIVLRVKDEGPGIPSKYHARIFERFFSVDKARSRTMGGSGLGLSIVKHIVLNHHGHVFVEDNEPSGAVFTILIPKC